MKLLKIFNPYENILSKINSIIDIVEDLHPEYTQISDSDLKKKTKYFLKRIQLGEGMEDLLPEALATIREAAFRVHKIFAFRVQLIGALIIYEGNFAEMKTGEGKTLTIALAAYIVALEGKGVHIVTVNEYLVKRDADFCRKIFNFLGMTVGFNTSGLAKYLKKEMFQCDVTYTTNSELAFDFLRDNMSKIEEEIIIPELNFCIIDEGDSVLIDEASTPLIISVPFEQTMGDYIEIDLAVKKLNKSDYKIDWETKTVILLSSGIIKLEHALNIKKLYSFDNSETVNKVHNSLIANFVFTNGREYIVKDNKIMLIDQYTGRILADRSYNNGLQQAIQSKEFLKIEKENKIAAKITYQSFFRQYKKISALSGTALSESKEFLETYNMVVVPVPTNKKIIRRDLPDIIFGSKAAKVKSITEEVKKHYLIGQPILVGTGSVQESEMIYSALIKQHIPCEILNAKNHEREAEIISKAGEKHSITIATNIAGRGVDIKISEEVAKLGGLYVLGCEKNESKRVDDQLRGRSGRQGDPGKSIFFISLEDNIFKRFGADKFEKIGKKIDAEYIDSRFLIKTINGIQKRIQYANFDSRKNLIEYNEILSSQQKIIYKQRLFILKNENNLDLLELMVEKINKHLIKKYIENKNSNEKNCEELSEHLNKYFFGFECFKKEDFINKNTEHTFSFLNSVFFKAIEIKKEKLFESDISSLVKDIMIRQIDEQWQIHLDISEKIKNSINLRSMEQKSPLNIYVEKLGELFDELLIKCRKEVVREFLALPNSFINEICLQFANDLRIEKH